MRRSPKGVELTAYGQALYKRAVLILQETRRAQEEIGQMKDGAGGSLHLAVSSSALTVLPGALRDFRQRMPRVSVSFNEVAPPHSHELLESGHYDLLVQTEYGGQIDDGFTRATLYDLPLAVGARRPSAAPRAAAELHEALWLVPGNIESPSNLLRLAYAAHGLPPPAM